MHDMNVADQSALLIAFAPMEGYTDAIYRRIHRDTFGEVDQYFLPFISPSESLSFSSRQQADFSPKENAGMPAVPQLLTKDADLFVRMCFMLRDAGYNEVNLNLGCPSGTVTAKGKGAGFLRNIDALRCFLDTFFSKVPLAVSLKTRIGYDSEETWKTLLPLFCKYPVKQWILHPRLGREQYTGHPRWICYQEALKEASFPVVYNGDIFTVRDYQAFHQAFPDAPGVMLGRGMLTNPALAREIRGGHRLSRDEIICFHDRLLQTDLKQWPASAAVGRMHAVTGYLYHAFECPTAVKRQIGRAASVEEYQTAVRVLLDTCPMKEDPCFVPPHLIRETENQ